MPVRFIIRGEPASKANSRKLATVRDKATGKWRTIFIKSEKARDYEAAAAKQIPKLRALLVGPVRVSIKIFYATERPDLDASIILDVMQKRIYENDRQVREMHLWHAIDRTNPRAIIEVEPIQGDLVAEPPKAKAA